MADNWRILDLSTFEGTLRFSTRVRKLQAIKAENGEIIEFSLSDVNIVFIGIAVKLEPAVIYHLASNDVVVLCCDWKGMPISGMYPWIDAHGRVAARQRAQASLSVPRAKNAWMRIVKAKIDGQAANIEMLFDAKEAAILRELSSTTRSGDPSNNEAQAARFYWHRVFSDGEFRRRPGECEGGYNSMLDYAYTILRGHSMRAILSAGLTPALGIFHKGRSNAFALADDLIEPFRPAIDYWIAGMLPDSSLNDSSTKKALLQASLQPFNDCGQTIPTVMTEFAQQYGRYVEGDEPYLTVPSWQPRKTIANE